MVAADNPFASSQWIWSSEATHEVPRLPEASHYGVRLFRRSFVLESNAGAVLKLAVSADSRYCLWINGSLASRGPAKGDINHQFFDSIDVSEYLLDGENVIAALVLDMSTVAHRPTHLGAPCSVITYAGGFVMGGSLCDEKGNCIEDLSTDTQWLVFTDTAHRFQSENTRFEGYHGYFEHRVSQFEPKGWRDPNFSTADWQPATVLYPAELLIHRRDPASPYGLLERMIPLMEEGPEESFKDAFFRGGEKPDSEIQSVLGGKAPISIAPGGSFKLILDAGEMTTAFPLLRLACGPGTSVRITYAEALRLPWDTPGARLLGKPQSLANLASHFADESTGWTFDRRGDISGWSDRWEPAGMGAKEEFQPLHWRAFRYIGLEIEAGEQPVTLSRVAMRFCAYPYQVQSEFNASDPRLVDFWKISLRTMRLCSHETFEDCVHYEQMQYAGDTMITSRLAMLTSGDYRLSRQALLHFDWSRIPDGLTQSRYPSRLLQVIPSWSLHWITCIRDYFLCAGDEATTRELLHGIRAVLDWFRRHTDSEGLPSKLPYWNTADWCPIWQRGQPPGWDTGATCTIAAQYIVALDEASWIHRTLGLTTVADAMSAEAASLRPRLHKRFWSESEGLYFDRPGGPEISQYGNAWACVSGAPGPEERSTLLRRFPTDPKLAPVSFFGWHTIFKALDRCGAYETMPTHLGPWDDMADGGLSTWAEENSYWRSLCHAWTAHPALEFIDGILGIIPLAPGFAKTRIAPRPCGLEHASGKICTPHGLISVSWRRSGEQLLVDVEAPEGIELEIVSPDGSRVERRGGNFSITMKTQSI